MRSPFRASLLAQLQERVDDYYSLPPRERRQRKMFVDDDWVKFRFAAAPALRNLFNGKCAFCETPAGARGPSTSTRRQSAAGSGSSIEIERFRPSTGASNLDGDGSIEHYGWLAFEWRNIYSICAACSRSKRSLFPVEGERAPIRTPVNSVARKEKALLLDPCKDRPEKHLVFQEDGTVGAQTKMGETTIQVFNLNREDLIKARAAVFRRTLLEIRRGTPKTELVAASTSYIAVIHAAIRANRYRKAKKSRTVPEEQRSADNIIAADHVAFRLTARPIQRVVIRNFKALRNVQFSFRESVDGRAPCMVLLGENATGKSTLLEAIGLALAGAREASRLVRPKSVLSRGAERGKVVIRFWDSKSLVTLNFGRGSKQFGGTSKPSAIVLGFGALRYPEARTKSSKRDRSASFARIAPLIQPLARVPFPVQWLTGLPPARFDVAARALKEILPIQDEAVLTRAGKRPQFVVGNDVTPLTEMSAGYQTIVGVSIAIMKLLFERWNTLDSATAIVLIDELDAHLHPRWKMRIITSLRNAFPLVQFISSTHDPLILRGLKNGEVLLMRRDPKKGSVADANLPPIEGMQVDELLTSRHFGLDSTTDPESDALYNEYYHLLSLPPTKASTKEIRGLRRQLGDLEAFGRNQSENLMLDTARAYLRETQHLPLPSSRRLKKRTISRLQKMIDEEAITRRAVR